MTRLTRDGRAWTGLSLALLTGLLGGCGDGRPVRVPVSGRITYAGQPLETGFIYFWPERGVQAHGQIQSDGTFTLGTYERQDGAMPGSYTVTIESTRIVANAPKFDSLEEELAAAEQGQTGPRGRPTLEHLIPPRYADRARSGLTATVEAEGGTIHFDLPAEKSSP
jgi:hypothetical protein